MHHRMTPMLTIRIREVKFHGLAWVFSVTKNCFIEEKVVYLFEIPFANTKHLCSVFFDLHFYCPVCLLIVLHSVWSYSADLPFFI